MLVRTTFKPAGLPVFPPHADPTGDCVLARLRLEEPWRAGVAWPEGFAGGIAHRLDVSTSGAVAIAESPEALATLREHFAAHRLHKRYRLWVARPPRWEHHTCDRPLAHDRRHKKRMVVQRSATTPHRGRWYPAHTTFRHLGGHLVEAVITTGVTHQIRLHAAFVGIPIRGDRLYGGGTTPDDAPPGLAFYLHHVGFEGAATSRPVPDPPWVSEARVD
ncbi:MAG: RNA pseudouridine synthase, partial [Myxococcota bacterium]